jgi:hypothetical protein
MADSIQNKINRTYAIAAIEKLSSAGNSSPSEEEIVKTAAELMDSDHNSAVGFRKVAALDEIGRELARIFLNNPDGFF